MKWTLLLFSLSIVNFCENKKNLNNFILLTNKKVFTPGDMLRVSLKKINKIEYDSIVYYKDNKKIDSIHEIGKKLGDKKITVRIFKKNNYKERSLNIRVLSSLTPKLFTYKIVNEYPHDINSYTQGLEFYNNRLFESIGLRGKSALKEIDYKSGKVIRNLPIDDAYFAEGITLLDKKIYQLTWQSKIGFIYDLESFKLIDSFQYKKSIEGWGLCNDGKTIYKSDGSSKIWKINPNTLEEIDFIQVTTNKSIITKINEMEWVNGRIYANTYQFNKDIIIIINPESGTVEGVVDFDGLRQKVKNHPKIDVLNGIAYNKNSNTIFMTGKNWNKLFELKIIEK
ncbi:MAG: glutaminyl-peptide cyclotransferase [Flavobacteriaceae bacterium]